MQAAVIETALESRERASFQRTGLMKRLRVKFLTSLPILVRFAPLNPMAELRYKECAMAWKLLLSSSPEVEAAA